MKIKNLIRAVMAIGVVCVSVHTAQAQTVKRYAAESGIVEYKISGTASGTETVYFDQWGMREARYITMETKLTGLHHLLTIIEGEWIYRVDLDKKIGIKENDPVLKKLIEDPPGDDIVLAIHVLQEKGAAMILKEEMLGRMCDVWELKSEGQRLWLSGGLSVKVETEFKGNHTVKSATAILEGDIPEDKFSIPPDIQFIDTNIDDILLSRKEDQSQNLGRP